MYVNKYILNVNLFNTVIAPVPLYLVPKNLKLNLTLKLKLKTFT